MAYIPRKNIKQLKPQTKEVIPDSWSSKPAAERGYTFNWTKVRNSYLRKHPLCERCSEAGRIVPAEMVHHVSYIRNGGEVFDEDNLMALCRKCHAVLHSRGR